MESWGRVGSSDSVSDSGLNWVHASVVSLVLARENVEEFKSRANQTGRMSASGDRKKKRDEWDRKL